MNELSKKYYKTILSDTIFLVTAVYPFALSMGVCSGIGALNGIIAGILCSFIIAIDRTRLIMPVFTAFSVITFLFNTYGSATLSVCIITSIIMLLVSCFFKIHKKAEPNSATAGLMLATAFTVTAIHTNQYFGIGAHGNTVIDIIKSYVSLGFHGNWRGVLYGTIVMVIMITFHRKFKILDKTLRSAFVALFAAVILNLFLNPSYMVSAVTEIGELKFDNAYSPVIFNITNEPNIIIGILGGIALFFVSYYNICSHDDAKREDFILSSALNICFLALPACGFVPARLKSTKSSSTSGILAAIIMMLITFLFGGLIERIPVHACAVVLIVGAWQAVDWKNISSAFKKPTNAFLFIFTATISILGGLISGVLFCAVFTIITSTSLINKNYKEIKNEQTI